MAGVTGELITSLQESTVLYKIQTYECFLALLHRYHIIMSHFAEVGIAQLTPQPTLAYREIPVDIIVKNKGG